MAYGTSLTVERTPRFWKRCGGGWVAGLREALGPRFVLHNAAGWGRDSVWGLAMLERRVLARRPDVVLVEFSINDADRRRAISIEASRRNATELVERIRAARPSCLPLLMAMSPALERHAACRGDLDAYYDAWEGVARTSGAAWVDHRPAWRALAPHDLRRALPDGLHPTPEAARALMLPPLLAALGVKS